MEASLKNIPKFPIYPPYIEMKHAHMFENQSKNYKAQSFICLGQNLYTEKIKHWRFLKAFCRKHSTLRS